jgi:hypothetical protein
MISKGYEDNFNTLCRAVRNDDVALMECTDTATGKPVITICAVQRNGDTMQFVPFAKLFDGNPYEELTPPT